MNIDIESLKAFAMDYGLKLVGAIVVLIIGLWVIRGITRGTGKFLSKRNIDPSLVPFLRSITSILLKVLLIISVMGMVGIQMTSFIAILGAAGLAVGLALSGTLQNFAGGVLILILKPYKVGDFIDAAGVKGSVFEIQIFTTILKTPDNVTITIPNGSLVNAIVTNYSTQPTRRVDWTFGIAYGDSVEKAKEVLMRLIKDDKRIKDDPAPFLALSELADSSVNIVVRVWVESGDYWGVFFEMNQKVYNEFAKEGLNIPFPQMDVHLQK
jgi:small conductance mechanosensitive channel